jgi:cardiolipin-specific phospholipase
MLFWLTAAQVAAKVDRLRAAETRLLALAPRFGGGDGHQYQIDVMDTHIPRSAVPLASHDNDLIYPEKSNCDEFIIHSIRIKSETKNDDASTSQQPPLVLLHGYMNGAAYFYRNLIGLSGSFSSVYSLDLLGWGLSSRPKFELQHQETSPPYSHNQGASKDDSQLRVPEPDTTKSANAKIHVAEDFFVESLEAWRKVNGIPRMILCGHSMGGYLSVAYAERYPQHVDRLVLLSPVGVPREEDPARVERWRQARQQSFQFRVMSSIWLGLYNWNVTVGDAARWLPDKSAYNLVLGYVKKRLPALDDPDEQEAVADYLHHNSTLPGSGEYCVHQLLTPSIMAYNPTEDRIPKLQVKSVSFLYGSNDWMDSSGGLKVQARCQDQAAVTTTTTTTPSIDVYEVSQSGHLLMLDNWEEFNAGVVLAAGGAVNRSTTPTPKKLLPLSEHYVHRNHSATMKVTEDATEKTHQAPEIEVTT